MSCQQRGWTVKKLWCAAHAVYVFELLSGRQRTFTVVENILLIRAGSSKAALAAATRMARREQSNDPTLTVDGKAARQRFFGIRKVVSCAADPFDRTSTDGLVKTIRSGVEATYLNYRVEGRRALKQLMSGLEVKAVLEE